MGSIVDWQRSRAANCVFPLGAPRSDAMFLMSSQKRLGAHVCLHLLLHSVITPNPPSFHPCSIFISLAYLTPQAGIGCSSFPDGCSKYQTNPLLVTYWEQLQSSNLFSKGRRGEPPLASPGTHLKPLPMGGHPQPLIGSNSEARKALPMKDMGSGG